MKKKRIIIVGIIILIITIIAILVLNIVNDQKNILCPNNGRWTLLGAMQSSI